jgi:hypothetical protein
MKTANDMAFDWNNQGGHGRASAVWVARTPGVVYNREAHVHVMYARCLVDTWRGTLLVDEGVPFESLKEAKQYAERFLCVDECDR